MLRLKRMMSFLLALTMLAQMLPVHTFAQEAEEETVPETVVMETTLPEAETSLPEEATTEPSFAAESTAAETEAPVTEAVTVPETEVPVTEEETIPETEVPVTEEVTVPETEAAVTEEVTVPETEPSDAEAEPTEETLPPVSQEEAYAASGSCGTRVSWTLSDSGVLTISGTGAMTNYSSTSLPPWADYRSAITSVVVNSGVTTIGSSAFFRCTALTSVSMPSSLTSIGASAFNECSALPSVTIPLTTGNLTIGKWAFQLCTGLTSVTIPASVTAIGEDAFSYCQSYKLKEVHISDLNRWAQIDFASSQANPTYYSGNLILNGTPVTEAKITSTSLTGKISNYAFYNCYKITSVTIPSGTKSIGQYAFRGCASLTDISIPSSVTAIGSFAFTNCRALTSITIPSGVTVIEERTFDGCSSLTSISLPTGITSIGMYAFSDCENLSSISIPSGLTTIESYTFAGCESLTGVTIPSGVTAIGDRAFYGCAGLTNVVIPSKVTTIGSYAFSGCTGLTGVTISASVTSIGGSAFSNCTSLKAFTVNSGNTVYASDSTGVLLSKAKDTLLQAPGGLSGSYTIPSSVTTISSNAFYGCEKLTSVTITDNITAIPYGAFSGCTGLTKVTIPNTVTSIGSSAFFNCKSLKTITIPSSVTTISEHTFRECTGLTSVTIPDSVTTIGSSAFYKCESLTAITIPDSITSINNDAFRFCYALASVNLGSNVKELGSCAFYNCVSLTNIVIPDSVTSSLDSTFEYCTALKEVTIGTGSTKYFSGTFNGCTALETIRFRGQAPKLQPDCFRNVAATAWYPYGDESWTPEVLGSYGGAINWQPYRTGDTEFIGTCGDSLTWALSEGTLWIEGSGDMADYSQIAAPWNGLGFTTLRIGENVTSISAYAFGGCTELTAIEFTGDAPAIDENAFEGVTATANYHVGSEAWEAAVKSGYGGNITWNPVYLAQGVLDEISWTLDHYGLLTVSGSGTVGHVTDYYGDYVSPWSDCMRCVQEIIVGPEITDMGIYFWSPDYSSNLENVRSLTLLGTDTSISLSSYTTGLETISVPENHSLYKTADGILYSADLTELIRYPQNHQGDTDFVLPGTVTAIRHSAFYNCTRLTSVAMPDSVTSLGSSVFYNCSGLENVALSTALTTIPNSTFYKCKSLKAVDIPESVTVIGQHAFKICEALEHVTLGGNVTEIGQLAFYDCESLTSFTIPDSVITLGSTVFCRCSSLSDVTIGSGLTSLNVSTFSGCESLTSVVVPAGITSVDRSAFSGCTGLEQIYFLGDAPTFGDTAFNNTTTTVYTPYGNSTWTSDVKQNYGGTLTWKTMCRSHTVVTDPAVTPTCTSTGLTAGSHCSVCAMVIVAQKILPEVHTPVTIEAVPPTCTKPGLTEGSHCSACGKVFTAQQEIPATGHTIQNSVCTVCGAAGTCGDSLTWELNDAGVLTISGTGAMPDWSISSAPWIGKKFSILSVVIEEGVTSIGSNAFYWHTALTSIIIPASVTSIGDSAFSNCSSLKEVHISDLSAWCLISFGDSSSNPVYYAKDLTLNGDAVTSVSIPEGTTSISDYAFMCCTSLTSVTIPDSVTSIGKSAFSSCTSLTDITIPDNVTSIGDSAFASCSNLAGITIPNSVTSIGSSAFSGCRKITTLYIPGNVTNIGTDAFADCTGLIRLTLENGIRTVAAWGFTGCTSLTSVTLPDTIVTVGTDAFSYCSALTSITIPEGTKTIANRAFYGCNALTSVTIPSSVTTIHTEAFTGCNKLTDVHIRDLAAWCNIQFYSTTVSPTCNPTYYSKGLILNGERLTELVIPETVTAIRQYTFYNCTDITSIRFLGDAPSFSADVFTNITATAFYPASNTTWTSSKLQNYGGTLTWVDICASGHTPVTLPAVDATCTENGLTEGSHCSECLLVFVSQETIAATGHTEVTDAAVDSTCTETGLTEGSHCAVCGEVLVAQEEVPAAHTPVTDEAVPPTCTSEGFTEGSHCDVCGEILTPQEIIPAAHTVVTDEAVDATCTKPGLTEGSHCSACGEVFTAQQEIAATGHKFSGNTCTLCGASTGSCGTNLTWILEDGILTISGSGTMGSYSMGGAPWYAKRSTITAVVIGPEVTSIGTYAFAYCSNLKTVTFHGDQPTIGTNAFYKVTAEVLYNGSWSSDALQNYGGTLTWTDPCGGNHTVVTDSAVAATCTASGLTEGKHCSVCGMVLQAQTVVDALGHSWSGWKTVTAATCTENGQQSRSCSRCSNTETQSIEAAGHNYESTVTVPGCESQGYTSHLCLTCGDSYVNGYTAALGHDMSIRTTIKAATCTENGQEKQQCSRCSHSELVVLEATGHSYQSAVTAPGCETTGYTTHTCSGCGDSYKNTYTAALGHNLGRWETVVAATCTSNGSQRRDCSRCDHYETQVLAATGHNEQTLPAVPATCTASGLTEGKGCISCGLVTKVQATIPALGHAMSSWTVSSAATCTKEGVRRRDCSRCDHYETQSIDATGHSRRTLEAVEATCTTSGLTEGADCSTCGAILTAQKTVAALGHNYGSWTTTKAATCTTSGQQRRDCGRCSHYETSVLQATGHKESVVPGVAATCTTSGLTEGVVCSVCNAILTAQKTISAKGHTEKILPAVAPTCTETGLTEGKVCTVCETVLTAQKSLDAKGHTEKLLPAVAATCTTSGLTEGKQCSVCQQILLAQETVEAIGHKYVNFICQNCGSYASSSGSLGQNVTWEVDTQTGTLTITGSGALTVPSEVPWAGFEDAITEIVISDGITRIDSGIFEGLNNLTDITVSDGNPVYKDVDGILFSKDGSELIRYPAGREDAEYTVPETVTRIEDNAFSGCDAPETLIFPGSMPEFGEDAFTGFNGTICYPGEDPTWDPELLPDTGITWIPQYDQPEVLSITADHQVLRLGEQAVLTAQLNMEQSGQILWEVTEGSSCVHFSADGTTAILTAKAVTTTTAVTVTARTAGGVAPAAKISIDILPQVQSLSLHNGEGTDVTEKSIWWDLNSGITEMTFTAAAHPADAPADVTWTFSDVSGSYAQYTTDGNTLTISNPTGEIGMVTITATAADGSGQNARFVIRFTALRTETDTPEGEDPADLRLLSGKTRTLTVYDEETGKPLTPKQITWSMDEAYAPYAKIDAKGKLTAKKVVEKVRIEVIGTIIGSEDTTVTVTADLYPAATSLELLREDTLVNNQTISVDSGAKPLVLTANIHPLDAMEGIDWTISDKKEAFASYKIDGNVLTVTPKAGAKAGAVTVTATSTDGSKKSATVKLQFGTYARTVIIDKSVTELTAGDKAIQLSAAMEPAVVTKPGIIWSLKNPADKNYVSLSAGGKITPKAVLAPVDVVIVATSKDGMASDEYTVTIYPKSDAQLVIKSGDTYVTKTTQTLDVNIRESITLSAHTYGQEAVTTVEWSPLTAKGADITVNTDGTLTVRMTSPANLNITAKADDGRKATVSLKGVKLASAVEISQKKTGITEGLEIASGKTLDLEARLTDAANKKVTWSLEEGGAYATLSSGKLTAAKDLTSAHKVVVRATAEGGVYDEMEVMVRPAARGVQIYSEAGGHMLFSFRSQNWWVRSNTTLVWDCETQGRTISLNARVYPYYSEDSTRNAAQAVTWVSSAPKVAQLVTGPDGSVQLVCHTTGRTTITATSEDGSKEKVSFQLLVVKSIASLELNDQNLACGKKLDLSKLISIAPFDATSKKLSFEILEGAQYITLNKNGVLSAKKDAAGGKVRIRVTPAEYIREDVFAEITVTLFPMPTRIAFFYEDDSGVQEVTGKQGSISIPAGKQDALFALNAVVFPHSDDGNTANDACQKLVWTSSNTTYAEVENGLVTVKRAGAGKTVTITATATDGSGKKASVKIRITAE